MKTTSDPTVIYEAFDRYGFSVLRIDQFDRGDYAEIRCEIGYDDFLTTKQLQEIILKLNMIEENENIDLRIVHIDMLHLTMRINIHINSEKKIKASSPSEDGTGEDIRESQSDTFRQESVNLSQDPAAKTTQTPTKSKEGILLEVKTKPSVPLGDSAEDS